MRGIRVCRESFAYIHPRFTKKNEPNSNDATKPGMDESATFKRVHKLHDLRNVLAHWPFDEEADQSGISCDFINERGDTDFHKPGTLAKDSMITYAELDRYDAEASELYEKLEELVESAIPITEPSEDLRNAMIEEAIRSSDNVLRFRASHRNDNTDKLE
jgi:hypothetical protein